MVTSTLIGLSIFSSILALTLVEVHAQVIMTGNEANIILLSQRFNQEKFSDYIVGEVENNGSGAADFVQVSASFYDANGGIVGREFTYTDPSTIEPGMRSPFEVPIASEAIQHEGVRYEFTLQWTNPDGSKEARMIDSFPITPVSVTTESSQILAPPLNQSNNDTSSTGSPAVDVSQNQPEVLLQPKSEEESLGELPSRLVVTDDVQGDNWLPQRSTFVSGQLNEFPTPGATKGELNSYYPVVRFHFDGPGQVGLVGIKHLLLGPIKSYESPSDILEESRYYTNIPLNEQVVLELEQPSLNYFIASVQFTNDSTGVYSNIMDNKAFGTKSAAEDYLEFKIDEGNDYNILEDSDIDDIASDPIFQQIASNIICSNLKEYGFQVCQQGTTATTSNINQLVFSQYPYSIFEDQNEDNEDNNDDNNNDDNNNGGDECETNLECQLSGNREWAKDHISNFDELSKEDQESAINDVLNDIDEDYLDEQEEKESSDNVGEADDGNNQEIGENDSDNGDENDSENQDSNSDDANDGKENGGV
jgi:hypothetical protein